MAYVHMSTEFGWEYGDEIDGCIGSVLDRFPEIKTDVMVEEIAEYLEARDREYYTRNNQYMVGC